MKKIVQVFFPGGRKVDASIRGSLIKTDQSLKNGGDASSPEPFDYFLSSIATCAGTYVIDFFIEHSLSTEGLALSMESIWDKEKKLMTVMNFHLILPSIFPQEFKADIIREMESCTVKRHLKDEIQFSIEISSS